MRILMHFRHFPVAMGRFFHWAFEELGHEVFTVGPYSNGTIPWGDFYYPDYKFPPNYQLPEAVVSVNEVLGKIPFKPDLILQAGDTIWMDGKAPVPNFILATDPHALDYTPRLKNADEFITMQKHYFPDKAWVPYAYDANIHKNLDLEAEHDVVFCGLQYTHRMEVLSAMQSAGLKVFNALGLIYEDFVKTYNQGLIAFNFSSKEDLPARFWEGLAMGRLVLTSRVPDLAELEFVEDKDYIAFSSLEEAVEKAKFYVKNPNLGKKIATGGFKKVKKHKYTERALKIIELYERLQKH